MTRRFIQGLLLCAALALTFATAFAVAAPGSDAPKSGAARSAAASAAEKPLIDAAKAIAAAAKVDLKSYPNSDTVLVSEFERVEYKPDATGVHFDEYYLKALTEKGKREIRTASLDFTHPYSSVKIILCEIVKADGRAVPVDVAANSKVMVDPSQMGSNIYNPNDKVLEVSVPGVEIGDTLHLFVRYDILKPRMERCWAGFFGLESTSPIVDYKIEVLAPAALPIVAMKIRDELKDCVSYEEKAVDGGVLRSWTASNVPRYFPEPQMPPAFTVVQRLLLSTVPDWQTVSKWYWNLSKPRLDASNDEMKRTVKELTKNLEGDDAKIKALFKFVSQKIRYMGITTEEVSPGYEPHDVRMTFDNKYGVCRDKAALLVAMLRMAGLDAYPVLINAGPKKDPEIPIPYFNHAIACVQREDGSYALMDPTDESASEFLPAYLCDRSYLVAKPEGDILRTSPIIPASKNMMLVDTKGSVDASGALAAKTVLRYEGVNDNFMRGSLLRARPEARKLFYEARVKGAVPGAVLTGIEIEPKDLQDTSKPLVVALEFSAKRLLAEGSGESLLPLPWLGGSFGTANFIIGSTGLETRRFPFETGIACGVAEKLALTLDPALGEPLAPPKFKDIDSDTFKWSEGVVKDGQTLKASSDFQIKAVVFSPAQYKQLREDLKVVEADRRKCPLVRDAAASAAPDSIILSEDVLCEISPSCDAMTITRKVKRKILSYAGVKKHSELKISYNPVWDKVSVKASVSTPDGKKLELGAKELNEMDESWVASAPRYPAGKTLVASLPGVVPGAIIEVETTVVNSGRPFLSGWEAFQGYEPCESKSCTLRYPSALSSKIRLYNKPDEFYDVSGFATNVWRAKDVPALPPEDSTPPIWSFARTAFFSTAKDWTAYAKELSSTFEKAAEPDSAVIAKAKELVEGAKTPKEKLVRIRDFVAKSNRTAGPGFLELPLSCVSPAAITLADGYGDMADQAVLLYSLLRTAGFSPRFILASDLPSLLEFSAPGYCPQRGLFRRPLVSVKLDDEEFILGEEDQYDPLGTCLYSGHMALDLPSGDNYVLAASAPSLESKIETIWSVDVASDGSAVLEKTMLLYGQAVGAKRKWFEETPPEELRREHLEMVAGVARSAKPEGPLRGDFKSYPAKLSFKVAIPDFAVRDGGRLYFDLPGGGFENIFSLRNEKRTLPFYVEDRKERQLTYLIRYPANFKKLQVGPKPFTLQSADQFRVQMRAASAGAGVFGADCSFSMNPMVLPPQSYGLLRELESSLGAPSANKILLSE